MRDKNKQWDPEIFSIIPLQKLADSYILSMQKQNVAKLTNEKLLSAIIRIMKMGVFSKFYA